MGFEDKGIFCWFCSLLQSQLRTQEETDRERKGRKEEINNETTYCQGQSKLYNRLSHRDSLFRSCPSFINFFLSYSQKKKKKKKKKKICITINIIDRLNALMKLSLMHSTFIMKVLLSRLKEFTSSNKL